MTPVFSQRSDSRSGLMRPPLLALSFFHTRFLSNGDEQISPNVAGIQEDIGLLDSGIPDDFRFLGFPREVDIVYQLFIYLFIWQIFNDLAKNTSYQTD